MRKSVLLTMSMLIMASSATFAAKMPGGSFLKSPVSNVAELTRQVTDDAIVAARYAKHFGTTRNTVVDYFKTSLRIGRLKSDYRAIVYTVKGRTDFDSSRKTLPVGTYVFVDGNGRPVLDARTGDPITGQLDPAKIVAPKKLTSKASVPATTSVPSAPSAQIASAASSISAAEIMAPPTDLVTTMAATETILPAMDIVTSMPVVATTSSRPSLGFIMPVAAALGGASALFAGGKSESSRPTIPPIDPTPVPEPTTLAALALGASTLVFSRMRKIR